MAPPNSTSRPRNTTNSVAIHSSSTSIAKSSRPLQPIVRMVHVFAPQRITTDPENFRAIVQKLTGNNDFASLDVGDPTMSNKDVSVGQAAENAESVCYSSTTNSTFDRGITATSSASSLFSSTEHCTPPLLSISPNPSPSSSQTYNNLAAIQSWSPAFSLELTSPSSSRAPPTPLPPSPNSTLNSVIPTSSNNASSCTTHSSQYTTRSFLYPTYPSPRGISSNEYYCSIDDHDILELPSFINFNHDPENLPGSLLPEFDPFCNALIA